MSGQNPIGINFMLYWDREKGHHNKNKKQAGAELSQAQDSLPVFFGLVKLIKLSFGLS